MLPDKISLEHTCTILEGNADTFHDLIDPVSGGPWSKLIARRQEGARLKVTKRPPPTMGFGVSTRIVDRPAEFEIAFGDHFSLEGQLPFNGEVVVIVEHNGEWHINHLDGENSTYQITGSDFALPLSNNGGQIYLKEEGPSGFYRYFVLAKQGTFTRTFRTQLNSANPLTQPQLDFIADMFAKFSVPTAVLGTTLRVIEPKVRIPGSSGHL